MHRCMLAHVCACREVFAHTCVFMRGSECARLHVCACTPMRMRLPCFSTGAGEAAGWVGVHACVCSHVCVHVCACTCVPPAGRARGCPHVLPLHQPARVCIRTHTQLCEGTRVPGLAW